MKSESKRAPETVLYGSYKFLGIHLTSDLSWNEQKDYVFKKANKRLYHVLRLLARSKLPALQILIALVRSILEYGSPSRCDSCNYILCCDWWISIRSVDNTQD